MQMLVAYFFIFIERFTQSYEHNLALSTAVGKSQVNHTHPISREKRQKGREGKKVRHTKRNETRRNLRHRVIFTFVIARK